MTPDYRQNRILNSKDNPLNLPHFRRTQQKKQFQITSHQTKKQNLQMITTNRRSYFLKINFNQQNRSKFR